MRFVLWFSMALFFGSCQTDSYGFSKPNDLIERDRFILILEELSVVESYIQNTYVNVSVFKELMNNSGEAVLRKYRVTPAQFERTMDYYGTHQSELQLIYAQVLDSLNKVASKLPEVSLDSSDTINEPFFKRFPGATD